jgi:hypothetical protein
MACGALETSHKMDYFAAYVFTLRRLLSLSLIQVRSRLLRTTLSMRPSFFFNLYRS